MINLSTVGKDNIKTLQISANELNHYNATIRAGYVTSWAGNNHLGMVLRKANTFEQALTLFKETGLFEAMRNIDYTTKEQLKEMVLYIGELLDATELVYDSWQNKKILSFVVQDTARQTLLDEQTRLLNLYTDNK